MSLGAKKIGHEFDPKQTTVNYVLKSVWRRFYVDPDPSFYIEADPDPQCIHFLWLVEIFPLILVRLAYQLL